MTVLFTAHCEQQHSILLDTCMYIVSGNWLQLMQLHKNASRILWWPKTAIKKS